jgi:hypothetical protein
MAAGEASTGRHATAVGRRGVLTLAYVILRLLGAVLAEHHDEWAEARRYMSIQSLAKARLRLISNDRVSPTPALTSTQSVAANG